MKQSTITLLRAIKHGYDPDNDYSEPRVRHNEYVLLCAVQELIEEVEKLHELIPGELRDEDFIPRE